MQLATYRIEFTVITHRIICIYSSENLVIYSKFYANLVPVTLATYTFLPPDVINPERMFLYRMLALSARFAFLNRFLLRPYFLAGISAFSLYAADTTVLFDPASLATGPFPSNILTTTDATQHTGIRVNLPASADTCVSANNRSVCSSQALLNNLDGFSVNPRLMACFSGPVSVSTLSAAITIQRVGSDQSIPINQVLFDPVSNCAFAKPDHILDQQTQYMLVVTDALHDAAGKKVKADDAFKACLKGTNASCSAINNALSQSGSKKNANADILAATVFTTMSITPWLEGARDFIHANEPPVVLPAGPQSVFSLSTLQSINWNPAQSGLAPQPIPLSVLSDVGEVAFGLYLSPNYINLTSGVITTTPTQPVPVPGVPVPSGTPPGFIPVSYHVFLPKLPAFLEGGKYPVAIYGHGLGDSQFGAPTYIANTLAQYGIATLAIEVQGQGYGPASTVTLTDASGTHTVATPGRGIQFDPTKPIGPADGCIAPGAIAARDCGRQTAVDLIALVTAMGKTNGLGLNLDPNRIYYVGQSFGSTYGTLFHAIEPAVKAAVINAGGGTSTDVARLAITARPLAVEYLAPLGLLNVANGQAPQEAYFHFAPVEYFNDEYVFRDEPPVTSTIPSALPVQAALEAVDWLGMLGDPLSFAPHLKVEPLPGVPAKSTLFQFAYGDLEIPNPTESALIRAADAQDTSWFLRFDIAAAAYPNLLTATFPAGNTFPSLPHAILSNPDIFNPAIPAQTSLALAEQQQTAGYFALGGYFIPDPNLFLIGGPFGWTRVFEIPQTLPESLNYLQFKP